MSGILLDWPGYGHSGEYTKLTNQKRGFHTIKEQGACAIGGWTRAWGGRVAGGGLAAMEEARGGAMGVDVSGIRKRPSCNLFADSIGLLIVAWYFVFLPSSYSLWPFATNFFHRECKL